MRLCCVILLKRFLCLNRQNQLACLRNLSTHTHTNGPKEKHCNLFSSHHVTLCNLDLILLCRKAYILSSSFEPLASSRVSTYLPVGHCRFTQGCFLSLVFVNYSLEKNVSCPDSAVENDPAAAPPPFPCSPLLGCYSSRGTPLLTLCRLRNLCLLL